MKKKYYVCGMNGIISSHRKYDCVLAAYIKRIKAIRKKNMEPMIAIRKKEDDKYFTMMDGTWHEVDGLIVN